MTYRGGSASRYATVSGQSPHLASQYALDASIKASRASCSPRFRMTTTLSGSASFRTARNNFPRGQVFQYGFDTASPSRRPPAQHIIGRRNSGEGKAGFRVNHERVTNIQTQRADLPACAVGPDGGRPPSPSLRPGHLFPHSRNGPLSGAALCPLLIHGTAPSQGAGNLIRLAPGLRKAAVGSGGPFLATDFHTPCKAQENHVAHLSVLSVAALVERHPVQQQ